MVWEVSRKELTRSQLVSWTCWSCLLSAIVVLLSYSQESASFHDSHVSSLTTDGACRKRSKTRPAGHAAIVLARCVYGLYDMHKNVVQAECTMRALRCKLVKDTKPYRRELVILHNFWPVHGCHTKYWLLLSRFPLLLSTGSAEEPIFGMASILEHA